LSISEKTLNIFDKRGSRWIVSLIFMIVSLVKTNKIHYFKYDKTIKKWKQYNKAICYYIDIKPNWNLSINYLEQYVYSMNFIQYQPQRGDIIIDIGAGIGTESIIFSMKVGLGKVYAIEAHPETCSSLMQMKIENNLENIIVSNIAISDKNETIYIENRESHIQNSIWRNSTAGTQIQACTLDEYVKFNAITKIHFLKMNIEGAEIKAIQGMTDSIKIIDYVAISCHDFLFDNNTTEIHDTIVNFLTLNNFIITSKNSGNIISDSWVYGQKNR
jgi:FkbM family methyltransferase